MQYAGPLSNFAQHANNTVRQLEPTSELQYIRLSCTKYEILMALFDRGTVIVLQEPIKTETKTDDTFGYAGYLRKPVIEGTQYC